jgi:hypothetical protein
VPYGIGCGPMTHTTVLPAQHCAVAATEYWWLAPFGPSKLLKSLLLAQALSV